jgi:hypothetical protein
MYVPETPSGQPVILALLVSGWGVVQTDLAAQQTGVGA